MRNEKLGMRNYKTRKLKHSATGKVFYSLFIILYLLFFSACSSAPKKPAEIFTERNVAASQLNLANQTANRGRYEEALLYAKTLIPLTQMEKDFGKKAVAEILGPLITKPAGKPALAQMNDKRKEYVPDEAILAAFDEEEGEIYE